MDPGLWEICEVLTDQLCVNESYQQSVFSNKNICTLEFSFYIFLHDVPYHIVLLKNLLCYVI